jgi:hypothetical protein
MGLPSTSILILNITQESEGASHKKSLSFERLIFVLEVQIWSNQFKHDLKMLTYIPLNLTPFPESFGDILKNRRI